MTLKERIVFVSKKTKLEKTIQEYEQAVAMGNRFKEFYAGKVDHYTAELWRLTNESSTNIHH
jgi:hypothetical protein